MSSAGSAAIKAAIVGIAGSALTDAEVRLFRALPAAGIILFGRNIVDPPQLRALTAALRRALPPGAVLLVDQEGGRVARLRPPHWRAHPSAGAIGRLEPASAERAAWLTGALIGLDCAAAGFDVVCAPVLDVRVSGADAAVVGDRSFAEDPETVARLGGAAAEGLLAAGVQPVGKHAPGHGRAQVDSHLEPPVVDAQNLDPDLLPFARNAHLPWLMTAHILFRAWDGEQPATFSASIISSVIRGQIGFQGLLVSDDLAMHALTGSPAERAQRALAAGCDLALYCPGDIAANEAVLAAVPPITDAAAKRLAAASALARRCRLALDPAALQSERDLLMTAPTP